MKLNKTFLIGLALSCVTAVSAVAYPISFHWRGNRCGQFSDGVLIGWVERDFCRRAHPTHYAWSGPSCAEFTPHNVWIRWVPNNFCFYGMNDQPNKNAIAELESAKDVSASEISDPTGAVAPGAIGTKQAVE